MLYGKYMTNTTATAPTRTAEIEMARAADERIAAAFAVFHEVNDKVRALQASAKTQRKYAATTRRADWAAENIARAEQLEAQAAELGIKAREAEAAALDLNAELYEGWSRFFLVKHIHNSLHCSSFRPTTKVGWLPNVSGLTEAEAVAEHGATLCTICFPTAPVALTTPQTDPSVCAGSGKVYDAEKLTGRERAYYSPTGTCGTCGQVVGLTARNSAKVRKHKA
jgi:hypothetical protein